MFNIHRAERFAVAFGAPLDYSIAECDEYAVLVDQRLAGKVAVF
jgi:hypothetical protein